MQYKNQILIMLIRFFRIANSSMCYFCHNNHGECLNKGMNSVMFSDFN